MATRKTRTLLRNEKSQHEEGNIHFASVWLLKGGKEGLRPSEEEGTGIVEIVVVENCGWCWFVVLSFGGKDKNLTSFSVTHFSL